MYSMDRETLLAIARLAEHRATLNDVPHLTGHRDGMYRVGAKAALEQLAMDLEVMARFADGGDIAKT